MNNPNNHFVDNPYSDLFYWNAEKECLTKSKVVATEIDVKSHTATYTMADGATVSHALNRPAPLYKSQDDFDKCNPCKGSSGYSIYVNGDNRNRIDVTETDNGELLAEVFYFDAKSKSGIVKVSLPVVKITSTDKAGHYLHFVHFEDEERQYYANYTMCLENNDIPVDNDGKITIRKGYMKALKLDDDQKEALKKAEQAFAELTTKMGMFIVWDSCNDCFEAFNARGFDSIECIYGGEVEDESLRRIERYSKINCGETFLTPNNGKWSFANSDDCYDFYVKDKE